MDKNWFHRLDLMWFTIETDEATVAEIYKNCFAKEGFLPAITLRREGGCLQAGLVPTDGEKLAAWLKGRGIRELYAPADRAAPEAGR